jgi:hypothetical protein
LFSIILFSIAACKQGINFDSARRGERVDLGIYPNRKLMIDDLVKNYQLVGMSYSDIVNLLGKPDGNMHQDSVRLYYDIELDYGFDIDPVYSKTLEIQLSIDSLVSSFSIKEVRK